MCLREAERSADMAKTKKQAARPRRVARPFATVDALERKLSEPTAGVIEAMKDLGGDLLILGAGGKMGPTLAQMAARACATARVDWNVTCVSRKFPPDIQRRLDRCGVKTIAADLLSPGALDGLPDAPNVIYMLGRKFGSTGAEWETWATNVFLAGLAANRYKCARIVAFSSGNVYPFEPIGRGSTETTVPEPVGEYAASCLGRERMFDYYSQHAGTKMLHFRLNYAVELRYGVPYDVGRKVCNDCPVDVTMGYANMVWQGYANAVALQCFPLASSPPRILNVTGPETVSIRRMAERFGALMGKKPQCVGEEAPTALLSNAAQCHRLFGYPQVSIDMVVEWVAQWIMTGGESLDMPTHYETRDGRF